MSKKIKIIFNTSLNINQKILFKLYSKNSKYTDIEEVYEDLISTLDPLQLDIFNTFFNRKNLTVKTKINEFLLLEKDLEGKSYFSLKRKIFEFLQTGTSLIIDYTDKHNNRRDIYVDTIDPELDTPLYDELAFTYIVDLDDKKLKKLYFKQMHSIREKKHSL